MRRGQCKVAQNSARNLQNWTWYAKLGTGLAKEIRGENRRQSQAGAGCQVEMKKVLLLHAVENSLIGFKF